MANPIRRIGDTTFSVKNNHAEFKLGDPGKERHILVCGTLKPCVASEMPWPMRIQQLQKSDILGLEWLGTLWSDEAEPGRQYLQLGALDNTIMDLGIHNRKPPAVIQVQWRCFLRAGEPTGKSFDRVLRDEIQRHWCDFALLALA
jgi:hypothetical protein